MTAAIPATLLEAVRALPSTIVSNQPGELLDTAVAYRAIKVLTDLAAIGGGGNGSVSIPDTTFSTRLATAATQPVNVVYGGSSSIAGEKASAPENRFVNIFHGGLQLARPSGRPSSNAQSLETPVQASSGGTGFTPNTMPGVHGYNSGTGGALSNNFLLTSTIASLATTLAPAAWVFMVGSNDAVNGVTPDAYKTNLLGRVNAVKANMPAGSSYAIYLIHQYLRPSLRNPAYPWASYFTVLQEIQDENPTIVRAIDLSGALPGVPGPDNTAALATGYIDADLIHMTNAGHRVWAGAVHTAIRGTTLPAGTPNFTGPISSTGTDTFSNTASATQLVGWTTNTGTWGTDPDGRAYMATGSNGVATKEVNLRNGTLTWSAIVPSSGVAGVRARAVGASEGVSCYIDKAAGNLLMSTIIAAQNANLSGASMPLPSNVAGAALTVKFTFNEEVLTAWVVGGTTVITATLTPAQMAELAGTAIALRQTVSGTANAAADAVTWSSVVEASPGSPGSGTTPGTGTVVATDTFTGAAGSAWSAQWVSNYGTGPAATQNGAGGGNLVTPASAYGGARYQYLDGMAAAADQEVRLDWKNDGTLAEQYFTLGLRSPGTIDSGTGNMLSCYTVLINPTSATGIRLQRRAAGGGATELAALAWTFVAGQAISIRARAIGSEISFRAWPQGTTEPTTWVTVTDFTWSQPGKVFIRYGNGPAATSRTGTVSNVSVSLPGGSSGVGDGVRFTATANTPVPTTSLPGWDLKMFDDFTTNVAAGSSGFKAAYPGMATYDGFGDTAHNAIVRRDREAGGPGTPDYSKSAWYSDRSLSVANSQLVCRVGWDDALQKNLVSFILPDRYTGYIMGRVDFLLRTDVILDYKIVPLWWSASKPDLWEHGEIDYPESNDLGTTFKAYIHNTLGEPKINQIAVEPVRFPGVTTAPRLDTWHVFSQRWTETEISFWLDGVKVVSYSKPASGNGFPTNPMRFGFQIEAKDLDGFTTISRTAIGNVQIGWVTMWTRNAATA